MTVKTLTGHRAADDTIYKHGHAPQGPDDTPERELEKAEALEGVAHGMTLPNEEDVPVGSPGCQHCEVLPLPLKGPGTLRLRFPHTFTLGKILEYLAQSPWPHQEAGGILSVRAPAGSLAPLLSPLLDRMSSVEQRDTRAVFHADGALPQAEDPFEIEALPAFVQRARSDWLLDILRGQRLFSVFQPIITCPIGPDSRPAIHGYECLMRADLNGETVSPGAMLEMARGAGLVFQLDLAARRAAVVGAAEAGITQKVFVNFSPNSLYNPVSCLDSTVRMIDELGLARERVVFEIIESERLPEMAHLQRIVGFYRDNGFGVALDDLGSGFSSLSLLLALRPDYVKLDMGLVQNVDRDPDRAIVACKVLEAAHDLGLKTVAEGVERPEEWDWVRSNGADFAQGYLFARPASPPPPLAP